MMRCLIILCFVGLLSLGQLDYEDTSSSEINISYYNLVEKEVMDDNGTIIIFFKMNMSSFFNL